VITIRHNKVSLALWPLRERGEGRPLLLLHGLGERTPTAVPAPLAAWPGPVYGLDFTGHGASSVPPGGGYVPETLMADADVALGHLGPVTIHGRGLGGYVGLLLAGARPAEVRGAIVGDGPGLRGGGPEPGSTIIAVPHAGAPRVPDPFALLELSKDVRPTDYAQTFARQASALSGLETAIAITARNRPPWLAAVEQEPGVVATDTPSALALFA
jgi:pimeloyl-ACP methyl ester carboxylesterase